MLDLGSQPVAYSKLSADPTDNSVEDPKEETVTDATVGPEGGKLHKEWITVTFTEDAFNQNEELSLSEMTDSG